MDDSKKWVNDRREMGKIYTRNKNYIISCDEPELFVAEIEKRKNY